MPQLVFIHGPGAGSCADAWTSQLTQFPGSVAPTLPGCFEGSHCPSVERYMEWVRGWLWQRGLKKDLVLAGFTLGASIALQYGLDYPDEVAGLILMAVAAGPSGHSGSPHTDMRLKAAAGDTHAYQKWIDFQLDRMRWIEPAVRERLLERHRQIGPMSQYKMLEAHHHFDVRDRLHTLKPKLLLIRGIDDPVKPPETEQEIHEKVSGSELVRISKAGHFPATEQPQEVNRLIARFVATL